MPKRLAAALQSGAGRTFLKNSAALMSGTVFSQAIAVLFSPVLSRVYGLVDFGNLANYGAWVSILALLSCLRYEHAIIVARDRESTNQVVALTAVLSIAGTLIYAVAAVAIHLFSAAGGYLESLRDIVLFVPAGVLAICVSSPLTQLHIKAGKFRTLASVAAVQMAVTVAVQLVLGFFRVPQGLIIGSIAGTVVAGAALSGVLFEGRRYRDVMTAATFRRLGETARQHVNFPRYTLAADAITVIAQQFTPVFILGLFGPALAGLYAFALRAIRVPLVVVATAFSNVLRREAMSHLERANGLGRLHGVMVRGLVAVGVIPFALLLLFGQEMFTVVFGSQWSDAGRVVEILSPGILSEFVAYPLSVFFLVTGNQRYTFATQVAGFAGLLGALVAGKYYTDGFLATCYLVSGVMVITNLASILLAGRVSRRAPPSVGADDLGSATGLVTGDPTPSLP